MFTRLRSAWRVLTGAEVLQPELFAADPDCPRCAELKREVRYWQAREERTADRLLESRGLAPVAIEPGPPPINPMSLAVHALNVTEFDSTKTRKDSVTAAGPDAMTRGHAH